MKFILIAVLMGGAILLGISSCATAPKGSLAAGDLRLLGLEVREKADIRENLPFVVSISFEADGKPEIRTACFFLSGDGPYCFKVMDVYYGSPGTINVMIRTKNPGPLILEGYVLYIRDGKIQPTNVVSTHFRVIQK